MEHSDKKTENCPCVMCRHKIPFPGPSRYHISCYNYPDNFDVWIISKSIYDGNQNPI